jgi:acid phosphatase
MTNFKKALPFLVFFVAQSSLAVLVNAQQQKGVAAHHESLNAVLWVQTSVEYRAATMGMYALATLQLDAALEDVSWTAALEQIGQPGYEALPPAVILDVDETVLDNSRYQARLIEDSDTYSSDTWLPWLEEAAATPVPGSLEFIRYAASKGVQIIYLTNRDAVGEEATRRNLLALGYPVDPSSDTVLTRREREEWAPSDKTLRRKHVADRYRVLLLIGDNYGDFSSDSYGTIDERNTSTVNYASFWGHRWILIPNPLYGSWEAALIENQFGAPMTDKLRMKRELLDTHR